MTSDVLFVLYSNLSFAWKLKIRLHRGAALSYGIICETTPIYKQHAGMLWSWFKMGHHDREGDVNNRPRRSKSKVKERCQQMIINYTIKVQYCTFENMLHVLSWQLQRKDPLCWSIPSKHCNSDWGSMYIDRHGVL